MLLLVDYLSLEVGVKVANQVGYSGTEFALNLLLRFDELALHLLLGLGHHFAGMSLKL